MEVIAKIDLGDFFSNKPLYSKVLFLKFINYKGQFNVYDHFEETGYKDFCQGCKDYTTFRFPKKYGSQLLLTKNFADFNLPNGVTFDYTFQLGSTCQFCNFKKEYLIRIYSLEKAGTDATTVSFFLQKIGQYPALERKPENEVYNYLTSEDQECYNKALGNLSAGYGIGAYAYFRRIVENEIKRVIQDLSQLQYENADKVKQAWNDYQNGNYQMSSLIDAITASLPGSFKEMGGNPLKLLYQQTSEGIHSFSEAECLEKSIHIDKLLRFVIKRTSNLKSEIQDIQKAMNSLSK